MKIFKMILCAAVLVALTACGGSKVDMAKAKQVADKINTAKEKGESIELSDEEFNIMLEQGPAIAEEVIAKYQELNNDSQKIAEWKKGEGKDMLYVLDMYAYQIEKGKVTEAQKQKFEEFKKQFNGYKGKLGGNASAPANGEEATPANGEETTTPATDGNTDNGNGTTDANNNGTDDANNNTAAPAADDANNNTAAPTTDGNATNDGAAQTGDAATTTTQE